MAANWSRSSGVTNVAIMSTMSVRRFTIASMELPSMGACRASTASAISTRSTEGRSRISVPSISQTMGSALRRAAAVVNERCRVMRTV